MKKIKKMQYGYINYEKKKRIWMVFLYILIGIIIFLIGYLLNKGNRANLFTVIAFLSVLPTTKKIVEAVVIFPFKTPSEEEHEKIEAVVNQDSVLIYDYVFTSPEKAMALDCFVLEEGNAIGILAGKKRDLQGVQAYLEKNICNFAPEFKVKVVKDFEDFKKEYHSIKSIEVTEEQQEEVIKQLRVLAV